MIRFFAWIMTGSVLAIGYVPPSLAQDSAIKANPAAAPDKISMCIGCHSLPGYKASFPEVYHVPMIAGQHAQYIQSALHAYAKQERSFPTMHAVAASLSQQDIADIAAYYAGLRR
ncbi:cytochrome c [Alcaligenes endophyticus]|uniref:Cytochrome c n=2 Tax=Alcaligenes endophyticus TaxID=1929088 RepID=A0ABT8EHE5_9BURK|nr:cytochrome c [Alcaligenes endophyticus]MCX5592062.1 cytochrome c [Alcaligenes endophyticus]MDN4120709.1 cytochrome c [Alcaligenes endophyticus]